MFPLPSSPPSWFTCFFPSWSRIVFRGGSREQSKRGGDQPDSGGPGSAPQS